MSDPAEILASPAGGGLADFTGAASPSAPASARRDCRLQPWSVHEADDPAALRSARALGYVVLRSVISMEAILALRARIFSLCADLGLLDTGGRFVGADWSPTPYADPRWLQLQQALLPTPEFLAVGDSAALLAFFRRLFEEPPRTRRGDVCRIAPPNAPRHTTRPHQDHWYIGGPPVAWTAWLPLHDCPPDRGGLGLLPGSHLGELVHHDRRGLGDAGCEVAAEAAWACGALQPGDAVIFHCLTIHRAWHNLARELARVSVDFRYQPASAALHTRRLDGGAAGR